MSAFANISSPLRIALGAALLISLAACSQQPEAATPAAPAPTELAALQTPPPQYPLEALCNGNGGVSNLRVTVGPEGSPTEVSVAQTSGNQALDDAAVAAVKTWKFKPATRAGQPVATTINVPVNFPAPQVRPDTCFSLDEKKQTKP